MKENHKESTSQLVSDSHRVLLKSLKIQYNVFILLLIAYVSVHTLGVFPWHIADAEVITPLQSISVLITLGMIPGALRWFRIRQNKIRAIKDEMKKEHAYRKNTLIRISLLALCALLNLTGYFLTENYSFLLMAGMVVVASIFCIPTLKRIGYDLHEEVEEEQTKN